MDLFIQLIGCFVLLFSGHFDEDVEQFRRRRHFEKCID